MSFYVGLTGLVSSNDRFYKTLRAAENAAKRVSEEQSGGWAVYELFFPDQVLETSIFKNGERTECLYDSVTLFDDKGFRYIDKDGLPIPQGIPMKFVPIQLDSGSGPHVIWEHLDRGHQIQFPSIREILQTADKLQMRWSVKPHGASHS